MFGGQQVVRSNLLTVPFPEGNCVDILCCTRMVGLTRTLCLGRFFLVMLAKESLFRAQRKGMK